MTKKQDNAELLHGDRALLAALDGHAMLLRNETRTPGDLGEIAAMNERPAEVVEFAPQAERDEIENDPNVRSARQRADRLHRVADRMVKRAVEEAERQRAVRSAIADIDQGMDRIDVIFRKVGA